jgi:hypothetical protein
MRRQVEEPSGIHSAIRIIKPPFLFDRKCTGAYKQGHIIVVFFQERICLSGKDAAKGSVMTPAENGMALCGRRIDLPRLLSWSRQVNERTDPECVWRQEMRRNTCAISQRPSPMTNAT